MTDSNVELKRFENKPPPAVSWQQNPVGDLNPTYTGINDGMNSSSDQNPTYDFVPGQDLKMDLGKPAVPPERRVTTTTNTIYEPSAGTLHPGTIPGHSYVNGEVDIEPEYGDESSSTCARTCIMTILVVISLFLAVVAVVLVLLLWFGVIDPTECPTSSVVEATMRSTDELTGSACTCEDLDLQPMIDSLNAEAMNLSQQIEQLSAKVDHYVSQNANLSVTTNNLDVAVGTVNSSCLNTLDAVTDQLGVIDGLNFSAQLRDLGVFSNCIYEYLSECIMNSSTNECNTESFNVIVEGYTNIDLACHIAISEPMNSVQYAPITNLRYNQTTSLPVDASAEEVLDNSTVRCECSVVPIIPTAMRNEFFHCKLYRTRCLTSGNYNATIVT